MTDSIPPAKIHFKKLDETAILPTRGSEHAAGLDMYASESGVIPAHGFSSIHTSVAVAVPLGYYARIASRSGLSAKNGIFTLAGVVDSDYRGEVIVVLANHSDVDHEVKAGDRIAQMVIESIILPEPEFVENLEDTERGAGGLGSTGN
ncbi:MAG TPA: dUTP diphosphatase [Patescibacteria group bacterium]|nr:dUTP diphosphatase [Patescibacteria group bacterium]